MPLNPVEKHFLECSLQSMYALWSALLTVNGIMVSGFAHILLYAPTTNPIIISLIVFSCAVSLLLLAYNFFVTKCHYAETGRKLAEGCELTDYQRDVDIKRALCRHRYTKIRENIALLLIVIEVILVLILIVKVNLCI